MVALENPMATGGGRRSNLSRDGHIDISHILIFRHYYNSVVIDADAVRTYELSLRWRGPSEPTLECPPSVTQLNLVEPEGNNRAPGTNLIYLRCNQYLL